MSYKIEKWKSSPYHIPLTVEVVTENGKKYWFTSAEHAHDILTKYKENIETCQITIKK